MKYTDIAIIGGGLAGSTAAAMLGRAGIPAILIDPHPVYPPDFRVEKLSGDEQIERFRRTGLAEAMLRSATHDGENWIARFGYLLDKKPNQQYGIMYDTLINAIRAEIRARRRNGLRQGAVGFDQRRAAKGRVVERRGDFRAPGGAGQRIERRAAPATSESNAGSSAPAIPFRSDSTSCRSAAPAFDFPALTYFSERPSDRIPYLTLFPIGNTDARQPVRLSRGRRSLAARDAPRAGRDIECRAAKAAPDHRRIRGCRRRQNPAGRPAMSVPAIASPASCWSAMPSRPPARSPEPAATRCSPTSSGSATSISRPGSRPKAWTKARSRRFTTIRSRPPATHGRPRRPTISARCRSTPAFTGRRSAGRGFLRRSAKACCGGCSDRSARHRRLRAQSSSSSSSSSLSSSV